MRKISYVSAVLKTVIMLLVIFSLVIAVNAGYSAIQQEKQEIKISGNGALSEFYAEISFYTYEGEGCGCQPVRNAPIFAQGLDTDHSASGVTDDGLCVLELEYDATYQVTIEVDAFQLVLFDFVVIDDQTFTFHLQEVEESSAPNMSLLHTLVQRLICLKN